MIIQKIPLGKNELIDFAHAFTKPLPSNMEYGVLWLTNIIQVEEDKKYVTNTPQKNETHSNNGVELEYDKEFIAKITPRKNEIINFAPPVTNQSVITGNTTRTNASHDNGVLLEDIAHDPTITPDENWTGILLENKVLVK